MREREGLAPLRPNERTIQLAMVLLDYGVWQALRRRGFDEITALTGLLECVLVSGRQAGSSPL